MRDLLDQPASTWVPERAKVETEGWGAQLLSHQDTDGHWAGGAYMPGPGFDVVVPGQPWVGTTHVLSQLRTFGLSPESEAARRTADLIRQNVRWNHGNQPYWTGEVEPCVNGITVANGTYFGVDTSQIIDRLIAEALPDGGWNCEPDSNKTSFDTTINVLEGLLEFEVSNGGSTASRNARKAAEEYFLKRGLFKSLRTGEPAIDDFLRLRNPVRWQYDILRGLDYFRNSGLHDGNRPDQRLEEAIELVRGKRLEDGRWNLDYSPVGQTWFEVDDGAGLPSKWITLRAQRVLRWADVTT